MKRLNRIIFIALAISLLWGCGREFDPYWKVLNFRVLAVKSSHPELKPNQVAHLEALVDSDLPVEYAWSWCPLRTSGSNGFECPITEEDLSGGSMEIPEGLFDFDLGSEPTADFSYPGSQQLVDQFCKALQRSAAEAADNGIVIPTTDCSRGMDISIRLVATSGDKEIIVGKRVNLWLGSEDENRNPDVTAIQIRPELTADATWLRANGSEWVIDPVEPKESWWVTMSVETPLPIWGEVPYELRAIVDPESVDIWSPPAPDGSGLDYLPPESENILFRWMTTVGEIDASRRIYDVELNDLLNASTTGLKVKEEDADVDNVKIWTVVRDGRLGTDWVGRSVDVVGVKK